MLYRVTIPVIGHITYEVKARTREGARLIAKRKYAELPLSAKDRARVDALYHDDVDNFCIEESEYCASKSSRARSRKSLARSSRSTSSSTRKTRAASSTPYAPMRRGWRSGASRSSQRRL